MNTSNDNSHKCLFYCILFILIITIFLLLVLKKKKENYDTQIPITLPSLKIIQIDKSNGDLSELDTNDILSAIQNIINK